ncbi:enhanced serine sensitivity protein SseB C-terminal domain-containing protein [Enterococcus sp. AZ126]|uniref:enhanced serine sensitivity protein SseB C-terminal domain-containing protein n=1 Tax=Enterococcus sp. AZ126 TaxID=2774635 RepID=UPI003F2019E9
MFKKKKTKNYFYFPRNEESIHKIIEWLKNSSGLIIDVNSNNKLSVSVTTQGEQFLIAYTDVFQRVPSYKKSDNFITIDYNGLVELFETNNVIDYIWINPHSDSVTLNRTVFTTQYTIKENTAIQIGQPEIPPKVIIDFLVEYAKKEPSIDQVFLALMKNQNEFSYVVFVDSAENKAIVKKIGPRISELYLKNDIRFPVDFVYDDLIKESKYLIYSKNE